MSEPKRLIDETDSPLERLVLQAGNHAPGGDRLRGKVLVALGVGAAVASTSKTSLAMAAGWKQAIVVGALSCVGVASVVGYRYVSNSETTSNSEPARVAANSGGQEASAQGDTSKFEARAAKPETAKPETARTGTSKPAAGGAEVGSEAPSNVEAAPPKHEDPAAVELGKLELGTEAAGEAETETAEGLPSNVHVRPAHRGGTKRSGRAVRAGAGAGAGGANGQGARGERQSVDRSAAERGQAERAALDIGADEVSKAAPPSTLEQELAVLDAARGALAAGRWGDAQRHLSDYAKRFPRGKLGLEAEVLRIEALASSGDAEGASRRASAILKRSPNSVVAARLRRFVRE